MGCRQWTGTSSSRSSTRARRPLRTRTTRARPGSRRVNEDGRPHVTPVGAIWLDGAFWFQTGAGTRKRHNVERDPRCSIALSVRDADVVVEGDAARRDRCRQRGARREGVGGRRLAGGARRVRDGHHRAVQRTVARTAAVARLSHRATLGARRPGDRAWRPHPLRVLDRERRQRRIRTDRQVTQPSSFSNSQMSTMTGW